ncbi:MAG: diguanylate cyclase [Gammaproteobacteria bacterium]|nr:diguanylate cyclase [Gammaproteobacteria bacterium]
MPDTLQAEMAARLAKLRADYLASLPAEMATLQSLGKQLVAGKAAQPCLSQLHHRLHRLAGSGGTFGLAALSQQARILEQQVKNWLSPSLVEETALAPFVEGLEALATTIKQAEVPVNFMLRAREEEVRDEAVSIWLVDDDLLLGQEIARQLESFNYAVRLFQCLADADTAAANAAPDILLLDVLFEQERENATEALSEFSHLHALTCPLLFITSHDDFASRVRASKLHAEGYFLKPLDVPRLVCRITHLIDQRRAPPARVMIIDDDQELAEHYCLVLLAAGMEVALLEEPTGLMTRIAEFRPELILMDLHMPDFSGPELAGVIRQHDNWASVPIVYLSGETDLNQQMAAMDRGADDFLNKPISDLQLVTAVRVRVERARQLAAQISRDGLTGLLKHSSIKEAVDIEVARARRNGAPTSVVMLDIDHFKEVNDNYGHAVGDVVIASVAMLLRQRLRHSDIIGRYGGEEFVAVLPDCDMKHARQMMDTLRERLAELKFSYDGSEFHCTISAGLAETNKHPECDGEALLMRADEALYAAKNGGRNQVREAV